MKSPRNELATPTRTRLSRIFLIGYRGTGKSTVAPLLAQALGWDWVDADEELERVAGQTIRSMFAEKGETYFRNQEEAILLELCKRGRLVVATGGGVILRESNRQHLRASGFVIWLTADVDTICRRLAGDPSTEDRRPALSVGGREEVAQLLQTRQSLYESTADLTLNTVGVEPSALVQSILPVLPSRLE